MDKEYTMMEEENEVEERRNKENTEEDDEVFGKKGRKHVAKENENKTTHRPRTRK
ncbi:MAG: hypothetical protein LBC89_02860 [Bacteroidales bacterium]|jgi:hypothetical protein|nr:hypothetical protein [Bacteroidales bacterium]